MPFIEKMEKNKEGKRIEKAWKMYREQYDKMEKEIMDEIGEVTYEEASEADSYLSILHAKLEDKADDKFIKMLNEENKREKSGLHKE